MTTPLLNRPPLVPTKEYELPCRVCDPASDNPFCTCPDGAGLLGLPPADYGDDVDLTDDEPLTDEVEVLLIELAVDAGADPPDIDLLEAA